MSPGTVSPGWYRSVDHVDVLQYGGPGGQAHGGRGAQLTVDGLQESVTSGIGTTRGSHPATASASSIAALAAGGWAIENTEATMNPPGRTTRRISTSEATGWARWLSTNAAAAPSTTPSTNGSPTDVTHHGRRPRRGLMGQHRPRGVDRDHLSPGPGPDGRPLRIPTPTSSTSWPASAWALASRASASGLYTSSA